MGVSKWRSAAMTRHFPDPIPVDVIRRRAYTIWEREGRPAGKSAEHWLRAEAELHGETLSWPLNAAMHSPAQDHIYFWDYHG